MDNNKNQELEKILSELNSNIQNTAENSAKTGDQPTEPERPQEIPAKKRGGTKRRTAAPKAQPVQADEPVAADLREAFPTDGETKSSFVETTRIIEEAPDRREERGQVRHIAVTAAEVVEAPPQPKKRRAFDHQRDLPPEDVRFTPDMPQWKRKRMSRREKTTVVVGALVTIFVVIGLIATVVTGVRTAHSLINNTAQKEELARVIFPLVIVDIPEFESPESLDNSAIIQSAIWAFIVDEEDKSKYPKDDLGAMTVPDTDIEPYIRRLYGGDVQIFHQSIDDASVQMLYDSENKRYIIESTPRFLPYTPRVDKISRDGEVYTLEVSYVLPDALWNLKKDHSGATVDKVMEYRLKKDRETYQMLSVRLLEVTGRSEQGTESSTAYLPPLTEDPEESESLPAVSGALSGGDSSLETEDTSNGEDSSDGESSSDGEASSDEVTSSDEDTASSTGDTSDEDA